MATAKAKLIRCRATIAMPGVAAGTIVEVDPESPYMAMCLSHGYLVPLPVIVPPRRRRKEQQQ